jgi:hypothetical protein
VRLRGWRSKLFLVAIAAIGAGALLSVAASRVRGLAPAGSYSAPEFIGAGMIIVGVATAAILVITGFVSNLFLLWRQFRRHP